jgi:hypothetical protein
VKSSPRTRSSAGHPQGDHRPRVRAGLCGTRSRTRACRRCSTRSSTSCRRRLDIPDRSRARPDNGRNEVARRRRRGAVLGAGVQDPHRPVRRQADLLPRVLGRAERRRHGATTRAPAARSASAACSQMHANERDDLKEVRAGDIAAAIGLKDVTTGDTLCDEKTSRSSSSRWSSRSPSSRRHRAEDQGRPGQDGRSRCRSWPEEDPTFRVPHRRGIGPDDHRRHGRAAPGDHRRPHEARVQGRGERRQAAGGLPRIHPRAAEGEGKFVKQSGGRGQYGHVVLEIEPGEPGTGYVFENKIVGGVIPRNSSRRSTRASRKRWRTACWPATRWWT